jgi:hypothetical protein
MQTQDRCGRASVRVKRKWIGRIGLLANPTTPPAVVALHDDTEKADALCGTTSRPVAEPKSAQMRRARCFGCTFATYLHRSDSRTAATAQETPEGATTWNSAAKAIR